MGPGRLVRRRATSMLLTAGLMACAQPPSEVYVAGAGFRETIALTTEQGDTATIRVGNPLVLHATRESGPWVRVRRSDLSRDACWSTTPHEREPEAAGSLRWFADPPASAEFGGVRRKPDGSIDLARDVRFAAPGRYRLTAVSSWCEVPYHGDTLIVDVLR